MNSFASELGVPFSIRLEAMHVINPARQLLAASVGFAPDCSPILGTHQSASVSLADGGTDLLFLPFALLPAWCLLLALPRMWCCVCIASSIPPTFFVLLPLSIDVCSPCLSFDLRRLSTRTQSVNPCFGSPKRCRMEW